MRLSLRPDRLLAAYDNVTPELLREKGLVLHRPYVGRYACSMEMQGMSLSLMKLDDELKRLLDAPADSPFFKQF